MKVWLTDRVLFTGLIEEAEGHLCTGRTDLIQVNNRDSESRMIIKPNWHASKEEAITNAIHKLNWAIKRQKYLLADNQSKLDNFIKFRSQFDVTV